MTKPLAFSLYFGHFDTLCDFGTFSSHLSISESILPRLLLSSSLNLRGFNQYILDLFITVTILVDDQLSRLDLKLS